MASYSARVHCVRALCLGLHAARRWTSRLPPADASGGWVAGVGQRTTYSDSPASGGEATGAEMTREHMGKQKLSCPSDYSGTYAVVYVVRRTSSYVLQYTVYPSQMRPPYSCTPLELIRQAGERGGGACPRRWGCSGTDGRKQAAAGCSRLAQSSYSSTY
jgi:hypothetical protein